MSEKSRTKAKCLQPCRGGQKSDTSNCAHLSKPDAVRHSREYLANLHTGLENKSVAYCGPEADKTIIATVPTHKQLTSYCQGLKDLSKLERRSLKDMPLYP